VQAQGIVMVEVEQFGEIGHGSVGADIIGKGGEEHKCFVYCLLY